MAADNSGRKVESREPGRPEGWRSSQGALKWRRLSFFAALSCLMLFQYQNCAQAPQGSAGDQSSQLISDESNPVGVIDDVKKISALSFNQKQVEIHSDTSAVKLNGVCPKEQEGAILAWQVKDAVSGQELGHGFTQCNGEEFNVDIAPTQELQCDQSYQVSARLGMGQPGQVVVLRRCAPDTVAEAPAAMKAQLASNELSSCVIERRPGHGCSAVCYAADGVVESEQEVSAASCGL